LGAATLLGTMFARPDFGLLALPVLTPFLGWMPKIPLPGVNPLNILLLTVFFAYAVPATIRRENVLSMGRLGKWLLLVVALAAVSVVRGAAFPTGFQFNAGEAGIQVFRCSMTFTVYFIGLAMTRPMALRRRLVWAIVLAVLAEATVTVIYGRTGRGGRAVGSFGQSNDLGTFLAIFTVFSAAMMSAVKSWFGKLSLLATLVMGSIAVLFTISRGAILGLAVGLLLVAFRTSKLLTALLVLVLATSPLW